MGGAASRIGRRVTTRFNVEHRAQRAIERQKIQPKAPPRHESSAELLKRIEQQYPELPDQQSLKDQDLNDRLKQVYLESFGPPPEVKAKQKLPQDRSIVEDPEFGHIEPEVIPEGRLSIRQLMNGLEKSMLDPALYTHREFALEYKLDEDKARRIFEYFKPYNLYTDLDKEVKSAIKHLPEDEQTEYVEKLKTEPPEALKSLESESTTAGQLDDGKKR